MADTLTWEEVAREYEKFREIANRHTNLKNGTLEIKIISSSVDKVNYHTVYGSAILIWRIESDTVFLENIGIEREEGAGPFLVLGTLLYIKRFVKSRIERVYIEDIRGDGPAFWGRLTGFGSYYKFVQFVEERGGGLITKNKRGRGNNIAMSFQLFDQMINREWKK